MKHAHRPIKEKVATNLSVPAETVAEAKALGINLSEVFHEALLDAIRRRRRQQWVEENREAISEYNELVEREGLFGDRWREF